MVNGAKVVPVRPTALDVSTGWAPAEVRLLAQNLHGGVSKTEIVSTTSGALLSTATDSETVIDRDTGALGPVAMSIGAVSRKGTTDGTLGYQLGAAAAVDLPLVAIVETAAGLREAFSIASHERVHVLLLGAVDLGLALGLEQRVDGQELLFARSSLVVDCAAAGIRAPVDRVWIDVRDHDGLARDCAFARALGYRGKALIHPDQVAVAHEAFAASASELVRAREVVAAFDRAAAEGRGVLALDGEMIDLPVVERARQLLSDEKRSVLHAE